jgi:hypothetical protein
MNKQAVTAIIAALCIAPAWAINKCTVNGKVVYQELPCEAQSQRSEQVKTWAGNTTQSGSPARRNPDLGIKGPAQAAPLLALYRRWADAEKLALSTSRIALAQPVAALQSLQREIETAPVDACMATPRDHLKTLVKQNVDVMIDFMGRQDLSSMAYQFVHRAKLIAAFEDSVKTSKCG